MTSTSVWKSAALKRRLFAGVLLSMVSVSCTPKDPSKPSAAPPPGGTLIVALPTEAQSLYPPIATSSIDNAIINSIYDKLADIGPELRAFGDAGFTPQLAASWTWAPDSLSIAFKLRPDAKFHDGHPVRAEDVQFSFRAYTDTTGQSRNSGYMANIDSVSIADSLTPVMWFKRRTPLQFLDATYSMYIMPAHLYAKIAIAQLGSDSITASPVGSGRFRFVSRVPQQQIEMISDTANYRGPAKLKRVIWKFSGTAQGAALSVFNGDADFFEKLQPEDLEKALTNRDLKVVPYVQVGYTFLTFNMRDPKEHAKPHPILSDVRVRHALTMSVDRVASAKQVLDTFAVPAFGPSARMMFKQPEALKQIPFDQTHARALLDSAGWVLATGKDVRTKDGVPMVLDVVVPTTSKARIKYAELIQRQFRAVGVTVNIRELDNNAMSAAVPKGKFDTFLGGLTLTPGLAAITQAWGTRGIGAKNFGSYSNPKFDADIDVALYSIKPAVADKAWISAFQQIIDDAPAVFLYEDRLIGIMHARVQQAPLRADAWFSNLADWSIDPAKRIPRDR